jgi:hypothetical protein
LAYEFAHLITIGTQFTSYRTHEARLVNGKRFCIQEPSMPLSPKTLNTIQAAGTAAFKADTQLKAAVKDYGIQVQAAMLSSPFDLANDSLFEEWKSVCRLSQAMGQIEAELQKIHAAAAGLQGNLPTTNKPRAIAAPDSSPTAARTVEVVAAVDATDVKVKTKTTGKGKAKPKANLKTKAARKPRGAGALPANAASLLSHLTQVLNPDNFGKINQTSVATAINMAKGSVGASVRRLVADGFLVQDPTLGFKLSLPTA